ncbi:MAG: hypothetical protein IJH78_06970 [Clostridia bacterium]|nr:hypothetical protein [Clostridia bacterium]
MSAYYIASCVFTSRYPQLSLRIQRYIRERHGLDIVRCCVPRYKITEFEERMPDGLCRDSWRALPDSAPFAPGDDVYSLCHNCNNIIEEMHSGVRVHSLWELIDRDASFPLPDLAGVRMTVQDCWRANDRREEQEAVRSLLRKMRAEIVELEGAQRTDFCGASLYRSQPPRNPKLAPKHYVEAAAGKFVPHTEEEQVRIMREYCGRFRTERVVCCCHYCLEGLQMSDRIEARHIAQLIFPE